MNAVGIVFLGALLWFGSGWVFLHDTVSAAAPEGTMLAFRFTPGRSHWDRVEGVLGQIPLISNRPLTAEDIRPFTEGEFAEFVGTDGTRSLAIHASKGRLPRPMLDSLGITVTEVHPSVFLLTDRPAAVSGMKTKWSFIHPPAPWKRFSRIGTVAFADSGARGIMYATNNGAEWRLPYLPLPDTRSLPIPSDALAVLSTPLLPNIDLTWLIRDIEIQAGALGAPDAETFTKLLNGAGGVVLTKDGGFLVVLNAEGFDETAQKNLLRLAAAMQTPSKTVWVLPDQSKTEEIQVDPSSVTVEEATVQGTNVLRIHEKDGHSLSSATKGGQFALTNTDRLLEDWLSGPTTRPTTACTSTTLAMDLRAMNDQAIRTVDGWRPMPFGLISQKFLTFSLSNEWRQTKIDLCM